MAFQPLTSQEKKLLAPVTSTPAPKLLEANSNVFTQQTGEEPVKKKARLSRAFCSPHPGAWRSYSRAAEICKTQRHRLRPSCAARSPSYPPRDTPGRRGRLPSGGAGAISEGKGSSGALPPTPPEPALIRGGSLPSSPPPSSREGRAGRCQAHGGAAGAQHSRVSTQPGRCPAGESCAEPLGAGASLLPPPPRPPRSAHPRLRASLLPADGGEGAPLWGRARSEAEGIGPARISHARTHPPATPRPAGRHGRPPPRSARPAPARALLHLRSPRHPGNAAPRRSLLRRRGRAQVTAGSQSAAPPPHVPRGGEARAGGGSRGREGPRGRGGWASRGPRGGERPLSPAASGGGRGLAPASSSVRGCPPPAWVSCLPGDARLLVSGRVCLLLSGARPGGATTEALGSLLSYQEGGGDLLCAPRWFVAGCGCHPASRGCLGFGGCSLGLADVPQ